MQLGQFLPVPADDTPLQKVLAFREAYSSEREELARAVGKLLLGTSLMDPASGTDAFQTQELIEEAVQQIKKAVRQLEQVGHGSGMVWLKRSLLVLGGLGAAGASAFVPPVFASLLVALSALGISVAPAVTGPGVTTDFAYLQELRSVFPDTAWPSSVPA